MKKPLIVIIVLLLVLIGIVAVLGNGLSTAHPVTNTPAGGTGGYVCNMDGKTCPDGSVLTRTGPNCEFPECPTTSIPSGVACTMEAKQCPDGSYVGRQGPKCEFAACPTTNGTQKTGIVALNQKSTIGNISITPSEILEDSRCPSDVQCIQAGTVRVRVRLERNKVTQTVDMKLNTAVTFSGQSVELIEVTPGKVSTKTNAPGDYRFTFRVI